MRRFLLLLVLGLGLAAAIIVVLLLLTPAPSPPAPPAPPPVAKRRAAPLQVDAEGDYVPGYRFTVNRFRFTGLSLHPDAIVTFARTTSGTKLVVGCADATIKPTSVHLRCDDPEIGVVTVEGRFLTRVATSRLDVAVLNAVVTVRSATGEILYSAQDSFQWHPAD
jgi:hypothetical protein